MAFINNKTQFSILLLSLFYLFGIIGMSLPFRMTFALLTPVNLLVSLILVLYHHQNWSNAFIGGAIFCGVAGYISEVAGVQTGLIFGTYKYGAALGWQCFDVPIVLAVNWLLLIYASAAVVNHFFSQRQLVFKALLSSVLMVALDVLIEPVAMKLDFWMWADGIIPIQNFIGWFVIAFLLQLVFFGVIEKGFKNNIAVLLFAWQVVFFGLLGFIIN